MSRLSPLSPARAFRKVRHGGAPYRREAHDRAKAGSGPRRMNAAPSSRTPEVREAMLAALPSLRAFALSLTHSPDHADDLVQDAIVRALTNIEKFEPGTNMSAWLFTILRNLFYSQHRRAKHEVADPDGSYAGQLRTAPDQGARCDVQDVRKALARLSVENREARAIAFEFCRTGRGGVSGKPRSRQRERAYFSVTLLSPRALQG